jgi:hypothetical protein
LEFKDAINLYYSQQTIALQSNIPSPQTWVVVKQINFILTPICHAMCFKPFPQALDGI